MSEFVEIFIRVNDTLNTIIVMVSEMISLRNKNGILVLTLLGLAGCGGGSSSSTPQSGQPVVTSVLVDGVEVSSKTYTVYSVVDSQGTLSDKPLSQTEEAKLPHVLILTSQSTSKKINEVSADKYKACYHDFWQSIHRQLPDRTAQQIVQRLNDFDMTIDELCNRQVESGLTVDEYVELFRVVEKYWPDDKDIDGKIARFFTDLEIPASVFKSTLQKLGYSWDDFVKRLSAVQGGGHKFINEYSVSPLTLEPFLRDYMARPNPVLASARNNLKLASAFLRRDMSPRLLYALGERRLVSQVTPATDPYETAGKVIDVVNKGVETLGKVFELGKTVWQFMKDNQGVVESTKGEASSKILSAVDSSELNYQFAKTSRSPVVSFVGKSFFFGAWETYRTDLQLSVDYGATHPDFGGQWIPDLRIVVKKTEAPWGYKLSGDAKLSQVVNRGSVSDPIPEVQIDIVMSSANLTTVNQTFTFSANGATGAQFVE